MGIIQQHVKSFSKSYYEKNMIKKSLYSLSNQIQTFLNFELTIFKISYLINYKSFLLKGMDI